MKKIVFLTLFLILISISYGANTMAILHFDNNSNIRKYRSLGKGLADMLTTDLTYVRGLKIVEREKLQTLMKELNLSKSKFISKKNALKIGKGLSAKWILKGSFMIMGKKLRIDVNIVDTETGEVIDSASVEGKLYNFFNLQKKLKNRIVKALRRDEKKLKIEEPNIKVAPKNFDALLSYANGLDLYDQGKIEEAKKAFKNAMKLDKNFTYASKQLKELEKRVEKYQQKRDKIVEKKYKDFIKNYKKNSKDLKLAKQLTSVLLTLQSNYEYGRAFEIYQLVKDDIPVDNVYKLENLIPTFLGILNTTKKYDEILKLGEFFLKKYPDSLFFSTVKNSVDMAIKEKKDIEEGVVFLKEDLEKIDKEFNEDIKDNKESLKKCEKSLSKDFERYKRTKEKTKLDTERVKKALTKKIDLYKIKRIEDNRLKDIKNEISLTKSKNRRDRCLKRYKKYIYNMTIRYNYELCRKPRDYKQYKKGIKYCNDFLEKYGTDYSFRVNLNMRGVYLYLIGYYRDLFDTSVYKNLKYSTYTVFENQEKIYKAKKIRLKREIMEIEKILEKSKNSKEEIEKNIKKLKQDVDKFWKKRPNRKSTKEEREDFIKKYREKRGKLTQLIEKKLKLEIKYNKDNENFVILKSELEQAKSEIRSIKNLYSTLKTLFQYFPR